MKKVGIYSRVSTDEQRLRGLSIQAQQQALREYCEREGYTDVTEYSDEGISANAMTKRKAMKRLLDDCRAGKIELILFTKLDRWFRSVAKYHFIQKELEELGVAWMAIHEPTFETVTAMGRANINFYLTTAQMEVDRAAERVKDIFKYKVSQGHALTKLPLGYKIGEDKKPAIDEDTVDMAKYILLEYEKVQSKRRIVQGLKEKFNVEVSDHLVATSLRNKRYTGMFRGNPDYFPKLITSAQYERNLELLKRNIKERKTKDGRNRVYIFSGVLRCTMCKRRLAVHCNRKRDEQYSYRCARHSNTGLCPNNRIISENRVERILLEKLKEDLSQFRIQAEITPRDEEPEIDVEELRDELQRLSMMYQKRRIDLEYYEAECERIESLFTKAALTKPSIEMDMILSPDFEDTYLTFTREEKRYFWRSILDYADVLGPEIEPHFLV